jgi:hypothetical protein
MYWKRRKRLEKLMVRKGKTVVIGGRYPKLGLPVGRDHEGMCPAHDERSLDRSFRAASIPEASRNTKTFSFMAVDPGPYRKKRIRIVCPECGRKVTARLTFCHDACCALYLLPPHKKKGWWKKTTARYEKKRRPGRRPTGASGGAR